jgi:AbrB family transcriptional regulator (stage V sporulation protein T)
MYMWREGNERLPVIADSDNHYLSCAMPIVSEGDIIGCVASVADINGDRPRDMIGSEVESKLIQTAATFLGKQLES